MYSNKDCVREKEVFGAFFYMTVWLNPVMLSYFFSTRRECVDFFFLGPFSCQQNIIIAISSFGIVWLDDDKNNR